MEFLSVLPKWAIVHNYKHSFALHTEINNGVHAKLNQIYHEDGVKVELHCTVQ